MSATERAELYRQVRLLYGVSGSLRAVAKALNLSPVTVYRYLRRQGVRLKRRGHVAYKCRDCGVETQGAARCPLHRKMRKAELNLSSVEKYQNKLKRRFGARWKGKTLGRKG